MKKELRWMKLNTTTHNSIGKIEKIVNVSLNQKYFFVALFKKL
jgi:hypothetical protein